MYPKGNKLQIYAPKLGQTEPTWNRSTSLSMSSSLSPVLSFLLIPCADAGACSGSLNDEGDYRSKGNNQHQAEKKHLLKKVSTYSNDESDA